MLKSVYPARAAMLAGFALILSACGGDKPSDPAADGPGAAGSAEAPDRADGPVNSLSLSVSGDETPEPVPPISDLTMGGGCDGNSVASIGLSAGQPSAGGWLYVAFDTAGVLGKGETGVFELSRLVWDNGVTPVDGLPNGVAVNGPNRFEGAGQLDLATHNTGMNTRRMVGTLSGQLTNAASGKSVDFSADIDINWSCGVDFT
ncbi:MAG: hypothetical protein KDA53_15940 [Hyphomonas sp.]|nr:hypothetical protein [Hyphomonas sp.]